MFEEEILNQIFGTNYPIKSRDLNRKWKGPSGVEYRAIYCGQCECYTIICPQKDCRGTSCNGHSCSLCHDDFTEFMRLKLDYNFEERER